MEDIERKLLQEDASDVETREAEESESSEEEDELSKEVKEKYEYVYGKLIQDAPLKEILLQRGKFVEDEALGFVRSAYFCVGELKIDSKGTTSEYNFHNGLVALKFCETIKQLCSYSPEIAFVDPQDKRKNRKFTVILPEKVSFDILTRLGVLSVNAKSKKIERVTSKIAKFPSEEFRNGFLLFVFLECGKLSFYGDYKINFTLESDLQAKKLDECLKREQFSAGVIQDKAIVFLKGEQLQNFVAIIGAQKEALILSDYYTKRSMTRVIRINENCKLANFDRQLTASANQLVAIKSIREANKFALLPEDLKALAEMREANPNMSLLEVAKALGISKSTAYHRMERIIDFSKDINKK